MSNSLNYRQPHVSLNNQEKAKGYFPAAPVAASQSLTVRSWDADATSLPSSEGATARTTSEWPSSVLRAVPVAASLGLIVWSYNADASSLLSSENSTAATAPEWPSSALRAARVGTFRLERI